MSILQVFDLISSGANFIEISCLTETHQDLGRTLLVDNNRVSLVWIWAI